MIDRSVLLEFKRSVEGKVRFEESLADHTSFRIGGPACIWVEPSDVKDLKKILRFAKRNKIKVFVIGSGTNLLVGDKGFDGIVVHLGVPFFKKVKIDGNIVKVGAGYNVSGLVRLCCDRGLSGIESLIGIPGTIGGAVYMNAGGASNPIYKNIGDFVTSLKAMDYNGSLKNFKKNELKFAYRSSNLSSYIILEASLRLKKDSSLTLNSRCAGFLKMKREKQALEMPSAGCVFKNPKNPQFTCGQMIDMLGLKGKRIGGAQVSERHANFIVNRGNANSKDVLNLIKFIRTKVSENYNIPLELEIKVLN